LREGVYFIVRLLILFLNLFLIGLGHSQRILPESRIDGLIIERVSGQTWISASWPGAGELGSWGKNSRTPLPTPTKVISGSQGIEVDFSSCSATVSRLQRGYI